jgi:hypothetical protein
MYPPDYRHPDDTSCPYCGVQTEVLGPPGPIHAPTCPSREHIDRRPNPQRKRGDHRRKETE